MKVAILGMGISGKAAARYLQRRGISVFGVDRQSSSFEMIPILSESFSILLDDVDLVVKSPGISPSHSWVQAAKKKGIPIVGEIDLAFEALEQTKKLILGVTGSNGKTTTTLLAAHLLQTAGLKALAVGNVGIPLITQLERDADAYVVELSSFQLEGILERGILDGAVILNLTPNHLDRHPSFEDYCQAKKRIASCLKEKAPLYVSQQVADLGINGVIFDSWKEKVETILPLSYRDNLYPHDLENFAAAFALTSVSEETLRLGIKTFIRPPHRLESVRNVSGVLYMNDSKATSVDAVIKAVGALKGPILLIAGGVDKGGNFSDWLPYFKGKVARVFALGAAAGRIAKELSPEIDVEQVSNLEEGIMQASKRASAGYTVLLSPGCSSYDQFRDYQHRGEMFRQIVEEKL